MGGPLRNYLSGVAQSPVGKGIGSAAALATQNQGLGQSKSLANNPVVSGYNINFKPVNTTAPQGMSLATQNTALSTPKPLSSGSGFSQPSSLSFNQPVIKPPKYTSSDQVAMTGFMGQSQLMKNMRGRLTIDAVNDPMLATATNSTIGNPGGDFAKVDQLNGYITAAAQKYGLDPNLIKAVMKLESGGDWYIEPKSGAIGYMQVMPEYWSDLGYDLYDPAENIMAGAHILKLAIDKAGGDIQQGLINYRGGWGFDGYTTGQQYLDAVNGNLAKINAAGGAYYGANSSGIGAGWQIMFGGTNPPITQEFGPTAFAAANPGMYAYGASYGVEGHPGVDVGVPRGTVLVSPVEGKVIRAGGSGFYCDDNGCGQGQGELKIKLNDGSELILGHMSSMNVYVGQTVKVGQPLGQSGSKNGDHVHVEYRIIDTTLPSGFRIVDPRGGMGYSGQVFSQEVQTVPIQTYINPANRGYYLNNIAKFGQYGSSNVFRPMFGVGYDVKEF